eukprot:5915255-Alexandrium_andersonii.AAC.1
MPVLGDPDEHVREDPPEQLCVRRPRLRPNPLRIAEEAEDAELDVEEGLRGPRRQRDGRGDGSEARQPSSGSCG